MTTAATATPARQRTRQLERFGFCVLPGDATPLLLTLDEVFRTLLPDPSPVRRSTCFHAVERDERMAVIGRAPALREVLTAAQAVSMVSSDVNRLVGDSYWHSDGFYDHGLYLRAVVYGERLHAGNGALRVIPGSHLPGSGWQGAAVRTLMRHDSELGLAGEEIPATVIDCEPGDVIVFNTNILHSAWGGAARRQWAWNFTRPPRSEPERRATARYILNRFVSGSVRFS
ncbi:phytanoyl-CoA dioxygenase family protein [Streptantibioticus ferralitis]|uniref:Phytanoyl-CoA dioxygenase family protein n=1 Tax=Streptantibioticus ferralitis TaxID=236510 RepID=A0ABT5ZBC0_9ACTN|nr:phytanoyl-CoA dioxygenase family protein [Streptantibioticus ferralitis]MDF2261013.1 phytanoyl-CoA dioxygenase family protein [Streptantibioticus ferralitis]